MANKKKVVIQEPKKKDYFKYVVIAAVLIIPFMYSFFYLKAYWNPYGEGNIDNVPVAIVNEDKGDKGQELIDSIKDSGKLKISVVTEKNAESGLNNKEYYAMIKIPEDFTSSMESVSSEDKKHATITYSPNQKSNYLASQIINSVVNAVEKNLDNSVNSAIVGTLTDKLKSIPDELQTISDGFGELQSGVSKLQDGSKTLTDGTDTLKTNYSEFNNGLKTVSDGTNTLNEKVSSLSALGSGLTELTDGVATLKTGSDQFTSGLNGYVSGVTSTLDFTKASANYIVALYESNNTHYGIPDQLYMTAKALLTQNPNYGNIDTLTYLQASGQKLSESNTSINGGISSLNEKVSGLSSVNDQITLLQNSISTLANGTTTLYNSSLKIEEGIQNLNNGSQTLTNGINTLYNSVVSAKDELDNKISSTRDELKSLDGLKEYSEAPVTLETKEVNAISSYGTAFSPFFISIALWVGCLMMYIVLYYDKEERFEILSINNPNRLQRTIAYHVLATASAILLGISLELLLDFEITSQLLYFGSIILIANTFMAIIEFLIINFKDIGKFIALILLVLQLAAAGGTFPIETVTKGFRWMHPLLPMSYTIDLLKESLISIESNLLTSSLVVVIGIFVCFLAINIVMDIIRQKKNN